MPPVTGPPLDDRCRCRGGRPEGAGGPGVDGRHEPGRSADRTGTEARQARGDGQQEPAGRPGAELFALAHKHDTCIAFEASVGGGIPIIEALVARLLANRIDALVGIVNGTCNVILTRMTRNGWTYPKRWKRRRSSATPRQTPRLDVSGRDAAQKLALLASLAFNVRVSRRDISVEGIEKLQPADITFAGSLGYVIKLLASPIAMPRADSGLRPSHAGTPHRRAGRSERRV